MNVVDQYRQLDDFHALADCGASQELNEECTGRRVDHRVPIEGAPGYVEEQLMGGHAENMRPRFNQVSN
jgi:hypothetical protein